MRKCQAERHLLNRTQEGFKSPIRQENTQEVSCRIGDGWPNTWKFWHSNVFYARQKAHKSPVETNKLRDWEISEPDYMDENISNEV